MSLDAWCTWLSRRKSCPEKRQDALYILMSNWFTDFLLYYWCCKPQLHPLSVSCRWGWRLHSWSCRTSPNRHWMRRCWHRRRSTCCSFHTAAVLASSAGVSREQKGHEIKLNVVMVIPDTSRNNKLRQLAAKHTHNTQVRGRRRSWPWIACLPTADCIKQR